VACSRATFTFTFIIIIIIRGGCVNIFVVNSALVASTPGQNSGDFRSAMFSKRYQHWQRKRFSDVAKYGSSDRQRVLLQNNIQSL
jgi:acyl-homoserine lactone acylase PvdQ